MLDSYSCIAIISALQRFTYLLHVPNFHTTFFSSGRSQVAHKSKPLLAPQEYKHHEAALKEAATAPGKHKGPLEHDFGWQVFAGYVMEECIIFRVRLALLTS